MDRTPERGAASPRFVVYSDEESQPLLPGTAIGTI